MSERMQEIFDAAYRGLASQGFTQSLSPAGSACFYRSADGAKCAAGWVVPDEDYVPEMEYTAVNHLDYFIDNYDEGEIGLLGGLQYAHDGGQLSVGIDTLGESFGIDLLDRVVIGEMTPDQMRHRLEVIAGFYGLTVPEV